MNVDTTISKNGCKPRGRPRKHPSDDHRINLRHHRLITTLHKTQPERPTTPQARRERNRAAQKSFRLRHQTNEQLQRQEEVELEHKFDHLLSMFLSFTDQGIRSEWANRDVSLMEAVRCSVKDVLSLTDDSPDMAFKNSFQSEPGLTALRNNQTTPMGVSISQRGSPTQLQPSPSTTRSSERHNSGIEAGEYRQHTRQDIGLSASINFKPPSTGQYRLDSPFSLQIAYLAIQYVCHILSTTTSPASEVPYRVFGSRLQIHTRQDILFNLRWHLGPGYSQLDGLATANFTQPAFVNTDIQLEDKQLYNADQISRVLRQRTRELVGSDSLDVIVNNGMSAATNLVHAPAIQSQNINHSKSDSTVIIRVSKLELLHSSSRSGICFGAGPAFLGADVKKAIWDSVLPGSYSV